MKQKRIIKILLLSQLIISCGQDYNSNSFDKEIYSDPSIDTSTPAGLRFSKAYNVLSDNCVACHTGYHDTYASLVTSEQWTALGLISNGDFANSLIIQKLINYGGDMPKNGSELSETEIQEL
jgi:hypothetical protein